MSGWGIAETAPVIEKIKAESADYLRGLNSCGEITWSVYDKAFDFYMELISRAYEQGKKDVEPQWIPCSERLPEEYGEYRITWTTSASKKRFIGDSEYEITGEWDSENDRFKGEWLLDEYIENYPDVKVLAWKPLEEPWGGDAE